MAACGTGDGRGVESADGVSMPSGGALTADQIVALAESAMRSAVSFRWEAVTVTDIPGENPHRIDFTSEWTSPDKMRNISVFEREDGSEDSQVSISLGDRAFTQGVISGPEWIDVSGLGRTAAEIPALEILNFSEVTLIGVEALDGVEVYRLEGKPERIGVPLGYPGDLLESSQVVFVTSTDVQVVRVETHAIWNMPEGDITDPEMKRLEVTTVSTLTYFSEPILIEAPDSYIVNQDDRPEEWISVPNILRPGPTATPTVVPSSRPGIIATFAPDDPNRHIPFYVYDSPYYDKLEIDNDILVSYMPCNWRNSAAFWVDVINIFYLSDGSSASSSAQITVIYDETDVTPTPIVLAPQKYEFTRFEYHSEEGRIAIEAVLNSPETMQQIRDYADQDVRCPAEFHSFTGHTFKDLPDNETFMIDDDTIARFEPCDAEGPTLASPILIAHLPSESMIGVTPGENSYLSLGSGNSDGNSHLRSLWDDEQLNHQLEAQASHEARCR